MSNIITVKAHANLLGIKAGRTAEVDPTVPAVKAALLSGKLERITKKAAAREAEQKE